MNLLQEKADLEQCVACFRESETCRYCSNHRRIKYGVMSCLQHGDLVRKSRSGYRYDYSEFWMRDDAPPIMSQYAALMLERVKEVLATGVERIGTPLGCKEADEPWRVLAPSKHIEKHWRDYPVSLFARFDRDCTWPREVWNVVRVLLDDHERPQWDRLPQDARLGDLLGPLTPGGWSNAYLGNVTTRDARRIMDRCARCARIGWCYGDCRFGQNHYGLASRIVMYLTKSTVLRSSATVARRLVKEIDRLVSQHGPTAKLEAHQRDNTFSIDVEVCRPPRPKGTDKVAEVSETPDDGEKHGGDGNSGEVDAASESGSEDLREGSQDGDQARQEAPGNQQGGGGKNEGGKTEGQADASDASDHSQGGTGGAGTQELPVCSEVASGDEATGDAGLKSNDEGDRGPQGTTSQTERAEHVDSVDRPAGVVGNEAEQGTESCNPDAVSSNGEADSPNAESEEGPRGSGSAGLVNRGSTEGCSEGSFDPEEIKALLEAPFGESTSEATVNRGFGGINARIGDVLAGQPRVAREVYRELRRLIEDTMGGVEESPRLAPRELVRRILSRAGGIQRARRQEREERLVVLAIDVSGSCSSFCTANLAAARAIALLDKRVRVVLHSNGYFQEEYPQGELTREVAKAREYNLEDQGVAWSRFLGRHEVGLVVAWGDWDAGWLYAKLCDQGAKLIWLDSYCCSNKEVRPIAHKMRPRPHSKDWPTKSMPWAQYQGVNNAETTLEALRHMRGV